VHPLVVAGGALLVGTALGAAPSGAGAQQTASVALMHAIPGATVDVVVDGAVAIAGFEPGTMQDLSSFAGRPCPTWRSGRRGPATS
jgi:hypothetical protein